MTLTDCLRKELCRKITQHHDSIQEWFLQKEKKIPSPFYTSVDLRDSGFKIAPVDTNLFPAGFNNICFEDRAPAAEIFAKNILKMDPSIKKISIIPEAHTQNLFYLENLFWLKSILSNAGFEVQYAWYGHSPHPSNDVFELKSIEDRALTFSKYKIENHIFKHVNGFTPDLIVLNNDFSSGYPHDLDTIQQKTTPPHALGWHSRKKSTHFHFYNQLVHEFCSYISIDPWVFEVATTEVDQISFEEKSDIEKLAEQTQKMLDALKIKYQEYHITDTPTVFIKSNQGTYGMGIFSVQNTEQVLNINRRTKNKMSVGKNKLKIESVILQEGIPTKVFHEGVSAEPVIYLSGGQLIGGFLRTNPERGISENLNSQGMVLKKFCMSDMAHFLSNQCSKNEQSRIEQSKPQELSYGVIAKLASFAAGQEILTLSI